MVDYHLEPLNEENADLWEAFNTDSPEGSLFHSLKWKHVAEISLGAKCDYFLLLKDDAVVGLFPFVEHTIRIFRGLIPANNPISLHAILKDYRDPLAVPYVIRELQKMNKFRKKLSFVSLSTLHQEVFDTIAAYPLYPYARDGDMVLDLTECPPDAIWDAFSTSRRKTIRRFENDGFEVAEVGSPEELEQFYRYHEENMRYIGGTLRPFSHFVELWNTMSDEIRITLLSKGPVIAGGLLQLRDEPRKKLYTVYLSLNRDLPQKFSPSYYLNWEAVTWASREKYQQVSFGLEYSNNLDESNPRYRIKKHFGAQFEPVHSRIIPLTNSFSMGLRIRNYLARRRSAASGKQATF